MKGNPPVNEPHSLSAQIFADRHPLKNQKAHKIARPVKILIFLFLRDKEGNQKLGSKGSRLIITIAKWIPHVIQQELNWTDWSEMSQQTFCRKPVALDFARGFVGV